MTPEQAAAYLDRVARRLPVEMRRGERDALRLVYEEAIRLSLGPLSPATLARMGHPYRTGAGSAHPPQDPAIINTQTGRFLRSWRRDGPGGGDRNLVSTLENLSPYSGFLFGGTSRMVRRPLPERVVETTAERVRDIRAAALRRAFQGE